MAGALGQTGWLAVCDTTASFVAALQDLTPTEIASELNADYLVMGSLQSEGGRVQLAVRLVEAKGNRQVWSQSFQGERENIFELQDRMAGQVLGEIEPRLRQSELLRSEGRHGNFTAFDHYLRATDTLHPMSLASMQAACVELDKATAEHPEYAAAHAMRAWIATLMVPQGRRVDERAEIARCRTALSEGRFDPDALAMAGYALGFFERDPQSALTYVHRALAINPSSARANDFAGWLLLYAGQSEAALGHFDRALSLCPIDEFAFRMITGRAFTRLFQKDFEGAVADARRAHSAVPDYTVCHRVLVAALAHLGREGEARAALKELLAINPGLSLLRYARESRFDAPRDREILFGGLKRAGMK